MLAQPGKQPRLHRLHLRLPDHEARFQFRQPRRSDRDSKVALSRLTEENKLGVGAALAPLKTNALGDLQSTRTCL